MQKTTHKRMKEEEVHTMKKTNIEGKRESRKKNDRDNIENQNSL